MTPVKLIVTIPGPPVPAARPRVVQGRAYQPAESRAYQKHVAWHVVRELGRSWTHAMREAAMSATIRWAVEIDLYCQDARRRDVDNLAKALLDGANGLLFRDDSQVDDLHVCRHAPDRVDPRAILTAWVLEPLADVSDLQEGRAC